MMMIEITASIDEQLGHALASDFDGACYLETSDQ